VTSDLGERLRALLVSAYARSDALFAVSPPEALPLRPIGLRHPFLFYLGHLPAFAWNLDSLPVCNRDWPAFYEGGSRGATSC
jgi:hypothetical protein